MLARLSYYIDRPDKFNGKVCSGSRLFRHPVWGRLPIFYQGKRVYALARHLQSFLAFPLEFSVKTLAEQSCSLHVTGGFSKRIHQFENLC